MSYFFGSFFVNLHACQSYQVFVNEHLILLTEETNSFNNTADEEYTRFDSTLEINQVDSEQIKLLVEWLFNEKEATFKVVIQVANSNKILQVFLNCFKLIEAAGGLVTNKLGELLMIYRLNKWDLPKGKIEAGEEPKEAAEREVEEECGITNLEIQGEHTLTYHMYHNKGERVLKRTYWYSMLYQGEQDLKPQVEEAIEQVEWIKKDNLKLKIDETYASLKPLFQGFIT